MRMRTHISAQQNILEGCKVLCLAALFACLSDVGFSHLVQQHSPTLAALGLPQPTADLAPTPVAAPDTIAYAAEELAPAPEPEPEVPPLLAEEPPLTHPLQRFFEAVLRLKAKGGKVRIGYFGDSMIEGDLVTQSLRNSLQEKLGGQGVGFVPIASQTYGFRRSIRHRFSGDWQDFNLLMPKAGAHEYGISGEYFLTRRATEPDRSWVRYQGEDLYAGTQRFEQVRLFYGHRKSGPQPGEALPYVVAQTDQARDTVYLADTSRVNAAWVSQRPTEEVELNFRIPRDLPVYGLSFESKRGIFIDNFASRGNSGMNLIQIPGPTLAQFQAQLEYDLIVLQFGLNVIATERTDFSHYERGMERVIRHFQEHLPGVDILLIGVSDKSTQYQGRLQTDPSVPLICETQRRVAERTGVAFLDLYQAMGGRNAMIQWVKDDYARSDYTHPNRRGAERVGNLVEEYLKQELLRYQNGGEAPEPGSIALRQP